MTQHSLELNPDRSPAESDSDVLGDSEWDSLSDTWTRSEMLLAELPKARERRPVVKRVGQFNRRNDSRPVNDGETTGKTRAEGAWKASSKTG